MQTFNYREFYQKALLPIGANDLKKIENLEHSASLQPTHCLIALQGFEDETRKDYFLWKVAVFPANSDGSFHSSKPFFTSETFAKFCDAVEEAKKLKLDGENDQLLSKLLN